MHIGKLLARLNPGSVRFGAAGGGTPEFTAQDIAAAIAMVPAGLGRELICRLWWPDGAARTAKELDRLLMEAQLEEWKRRMDVLVTAQLVYAVADGHTAKARADAQLEAAKRTVWPRLGPESCYGPVRDGVLRELSSASLCARCSGHGQLRQGIGPIVACNACFGTGHARFSDRARAALIDRDEATYRRIWRPVFEWTYAACEDALGPASRTLREIMGLTAEA